MHVYPRNPKNPMQGYGTWVIVEMARPTGFEPVAPRLGKRSFFVLNFVFS